MLRKYSVDEDSNLVTISYILRMGVVSLKYTRQALAMSTPAVRSLIWKAGDIDFGYTCALTYPAGISLMQKK